MINLARTRQFHRKVPLIGLLCLLALAFQVACSTDEEATATAPKASPTVAASAIPSRPTEETPTAIQSPPLTPQGTLRVAPTAIPPPIRRAAPTATATPVPASPIPGELNFPNPEHSPVETGADRKPIDFEIDEATLWRDVIARFSDVEVSCIREELGEERYQWAIEQSAVQNFVKGITTDEPWTEIWQVLLWGCLEQETSVDLFRANIESRTDEIIDWMRGGFFGLGEEEVSLAKECVLGLLAYTDFSRFVTGGLPGESGESRAHENDESGFIYFMLIIMTTCAWPEEESGQQPEESEGFNFASEYDITWNDVADYVTEEESSCIRDVMGNARVSDLDQRVLDGQTEQWEVSAWGCLSQQNAAYLFEVSDPFHEALFRREPLLDLSRDTLECTRQALHKVDFPRLIGSGLPIIDRTHAAPYFALGTALAYCETDALEGYENYRNDRVDVVTLAPGEPVIGTVDYRGDVDVFSIEIEEGKIYQMYVEAGSLQSPLAGGPYLDFALTDTYFTRWGFNRQVPITCYSTVKTQEFPMEWQAQRSGIHQVIVRGGSCDDLGTYTVTLSVSEGAVDD